MLRITGTIIGWKLSRVVEMRRRRERERKKERMRKTERLISLFCLQDSGHLKDWVDSICR